MEPFIILTNSFRKSKLKRILLLIILGSIIKSCLVGNHIEKEVFYIPKGLEGRISILFDCEDGKEKKWKDGKRVYEIPLSGVLKTQFKDNTGYLSFDKEGIEFEVNKYREWAQFYITDSLYNPIEKINYIPYYAPDYKQYVEKTGINVTGTNGVEISGNGEVKYTNSNYFIFYGDTLKYNHKGLDGRTKDDWLVIKNWNIFDNRTK